MQKSIILTQYSAVTQYILHNMITSFIWMNVYCKLPPTSSVHYTENLHLSVRNGWVNWKWATSVHAVDERMGVQLLYLHQ